VGDLLFSPRLDFSGVAAFAIDLTACWRPRVGMVTLALDLASALIADGDEHDELTLLCSQERPAGVTGGRAVFSPYRHEVANKLLWMPPLEPALDVDAILYPYWPSPPRRRAGAPPAAVFVHDLAFRVRPAEVPWQQRAYLGYLFPRSLPQAAAVIVPSQATRADLLESYRLDAGRVHVVPEAPARLGDQARLPPGVEPGFLLAVGTVEPRKNYPRLVAAYRQLSAALGRAPELVVVGRPGWAYGNALQLLQTTPGVRLVGHLDDAGLLGLYRAAAGLVFPSLYEGFGLPLLEAMREGLPALIGDRGALPEVAGGAALEVDAEDPDAIAAGMRRLLEDSELRSRLSAAGRARAAEFSWERSAAAVREILHSVAGAASARIGR
jgi:glycosyltransferase involved in cell wall biosynthesis